MSFRPSVERRKKKRLKNHPRKTERFILRERVPKNEEGSSRAKGGE